MEKNNPSKNTQTSETPRRKRHVFRKVLLSLFVIIVILTIIVQYGLGFIVRNGAKAAGPSLIGTEIAIQHAKVRPFFGIVDFGDMRVGPPESYKADVFKMENFKIILEPKSLLTDTIVVKEIAIVGPEITYELAGLKSNISAIMDRLATAEKSPEKEKPAGKKDKKSSTKAAKKVVIEQFLFNGAKIRIASSLTGGKGVVIPMPNIELTDIGKKSGGVTGLQAFTQIMASISTGIIGAVRDAGLSLGGAALDGTKAVSGAALEGTKAVTGVAGDVTRGSLKAVGKTLGGIFGGSDETNAPLKDAQKK